jgi:hypothetical protein
MVTLLECSLNPSPLVPPVRPSPNPNPEEDGFFAGLGEGGEDGKVDRGGVAAKLVEKNAFDRDPAVDPVVDPPPEPGLEAGTPPLPYPNLAEFKLLARFRFAFELELEACPS